MTMEAKLTFTELKQLNLPNIDKEILAFWDAEKKHISENHTLKGRMQHLYFL